jgi:hypothetical protein
MPLDNADLYKAAREAARARVSAKPEVRFRRGTAIYRNVGTGFNGGLAGANQARTIPEGKYSSEDNAWNRWTGRTAEGDAGVGGVYATADLDALLAELLHYTFGTSLETDLRNTGRPPAKGRPAPLTKAGVAAKFPERRLFVYTLRNDVVLADLTADSRFFKDIWSADVVQAAAARTPYRSMRAAYNASRDHSLARGVCQGLWDGSGGKLAGLRVTSVRTERATTLGQSGFNLIFLGRDGTLVDVLVPERLIEFVPAPGGGVTEKTTWFGGAPATGGTAPSI